MARLGQAAAGCEVLPGASVVGGGSLPDETLPTRVIALPGPAETWAARLRTGRPAVVGRIEGERLLLDLRTVLPDQEDALVARLRELLEG